MPHLDRENLPYLIERVGRIKTAEQRRWGSLDPGGILGHFRQTLALSLGEVREAKDISIPVVRDVLAFLAFRVFTRWPGGVIKAPSYFTPPPEAVERERAAVIALMERFVDEADRAPKRKTLSPLLGPITLDYWRRVHGKHFAHHFRQYGVL